MLSFKCAYLTNIHKLFIFIQMKSRQSNNMSNQMYEYSKLFRFHEAFCKTLPNYRSGPGPAVSVVTMTRNMCTHPVRLFSCLSACLSVSQHAPHWASVSGFVIKKSHQSQQHADWLTDYHPLGNQRTRSLICCQHYQSSHSRLCPPRPTVTCMSHYSTRLHTRSHWQPIESPSQPQSFPFRFHCKTNVMADVSHLVPSSFSSHSHLMRLMKKVLIVDSCLS